MVINRSNIAASAGAVVVRSGEGQTFRWGPEGTIRIIAVASTTDPVIQHCRVHRTAR